jgi:TolA-binding protein
MDLAALRKEVGQLKAQVSKLEEENARLRGDIQKLQTDPSSYETLARERFFLKKPGERVLYLPENPARPVPPAVSTGVQPAAAAPPAPEPPPDENP